MKKENSRGILMFAHNNDEIDYFRLAVVNSLLIQKHLGIKDITVVTDSHSLSYAQEEMGEDVVNKAINNIVLNEKDRNFKRANIRVYKDTSHTAKNLSFYNVNRCDAYDISPYDETILIDADYLILSNTLNQCWGHNEELMMNWKWQDVMFERKFDSLDRLNDLGITMYWATVVYFKKTPYAESFFNTVKHVKDNSQFYRDLYQWKGKLYRNDYSFSVAAHTMSGFVDKGISQLPTTLYKTFDTDDVHSALSDDTLLLLLEKPKSPGDFMLTKWSGVDLHVMNKWAINRISNGIMEYIDA
tara:strand:+ start:657 stop:1556 length:900 start_codon:yes stop_codon:yes gene_type:complete